MSPADWLLLQAVFPSFDVSRVRHRVATWPLVDARVLAKWPHRMLELSMRLDLVEVFTQEQHEAPQDTLPCELRESELARLLKNDPEHPIVQQHRDALVQ